MLTQYATLIMEILCCYTIINMTQEGNLAYNKNCVHDLSQSLCHFVQFIFLFCPVSKYLKQITNKL